MCHKLVLSKTFWGIWLIRLRKWLASTKEQQLIKRIKKCLKKFTKYGLQTQMRGVNNKLRKIADFGVSDTVKNMNLNN